MLFRPKYTINTIYNLDPQKLNEMGIKAVFSDLDNTLLAWNKFENLAEEFTSNIYEFVELVRNKQNR